MSAASAHERAALDELRELYAQADQLLSGTTCPGSTECCRFGRTGREPYVTSLETALIMRALAERGGPLRPQVVQGLSEGPLALPVVRDERVCPLLTRAGLCSVYEARPLGCRTFFCDRASAQRPVRHHQVLGLVRTLKDLAGRHRPGGDEGRPLTRALSLEKDLKKPRAGTSKPSR